MISTYNFLSTLEKKVYNWLTKRNILFTTQEPMFGYAGELGSAVVDFVLSERNIVLRTMGSYWHSGLKSEARDDFGKEQLINRGYIVVDLREEDLTDDKINHTLEMALEGQEALR
jgi:very-short-patch-repair endonuclease